MTDLQLVEYATAGDMEAFATLYRKYYDLALGIARRRARTKAEAEDAAADVFLWLALGRWRVDRADKGGTLHRFVATLARYAAWHQMNGRDEHHDDLPEPGTRRYGRCMVSRSRTPEALAYQRQQRARITAALGLLTPRQRAIYDLRWGSELSTEQIANRLQTSPESINSGYGIIRRKLRAALSDVFDIPAPDRRKRRFLHKNPGASPEALDRYRALRDAKRQQEQLS